jgi:hypothetical protein
MKKEWLVKTLTLGIIVLLMGISTMPLADSLSVAKHISTKEMICKSYSRYDNDTTPPVTTIDIYPYTPNGLKGWYVSDVTITLEATDDISGVNVTYYKINEEEWEIYVEPFKLEVDGYYHHIEFYSVDNAGNQEEVKSVKINIDQTKPTITLEYEITGGNQIQGWELTFTATATDDTSGMNKVEFYLDDILQETVTGPGPTYQSVCRLPPSYPLYELKARGLILNPEITDEYVKFFAIIIIIIGFYYNYHFSAYAYDNAGNWDFYSIENPKPPSSVSPGIYLFKNLTLPSEYNGYIGKFFIRATFDV